MSGLLRFILLVVSILAAIWIFRRIRKCKIKQEDAVYWIAFSFLLAVLGICPQLSYFMADLLGIAAPVNFVFLMILFLLIEKLLSVSIQLSLLESKVQVMAAELAIRNKNLEEKGACHGTLQDKSQDSIIHNNEVNCEITEIKKEIGEKNGQA